MVMTMMSTSKSTMYILYCIILYCKCLGDDEHEVYAQMQANSSPFSSDLRPSFLRPSFPLFLFTLMLTLWLVLSTMTCILVLKVFFMSFYVTLSWDTPPVGLTAEEQEWNRSSQQ